MNSDSLLYDKKTAVISVVLMVLVSVFILGGNGLRAERRRIEAIFSGQNELGIDNRQEAVLILQNTANLLVVADRYADNAHVEQMSERIRMVMDSIVLPSPLHPTSEYDFVNVGELQFNTMDRALPHVRELLQIMESVPVSAASAAHLTEIDGNIIAAERRISLNADYIGEARDFNRLLRNPYTYVIATVRGLAPLPMAVNMR